jgi:hypothetical protein
MGYFSLTRGSIFLGHQFPTFAFRTATQLCSARSITPSIPPARRQGSRRFRVRAAIDMGGKAQEISQDQDIPLLVPQYIGGARTPF